MKKYISPMHPLTKPPHQIFNSFSFLTRESSQTSLYSILRDQKKHITTLTMPEKTRHTKALTATILTAMAFLAFPMIINASDSSTNRKLEEDPIKCTPCLQNIPPPPPSPPPPSPACPPPPLPPSPPKKSYCPPPPSTYIYMTGPPGELYPIDQQFGAAAAKRFTVVKILGLIAFGVMSFLMIMN